METCKKCGAPMRQNSKFCSKCGAPVMDREQSESPVLASKSGQNDHSDQKKNLFSSKKWMRIIGCVLIMIIVFVFINSTGLIGSGGRNEYQETMKSAEKYFIDQEYEKAEELYLTAKKIDPKQPDPYRQLYRIYTVQDRPVEALAIRTEAEENLGTEEIKQITESIEEIQKDETLYPEYSILSADLGEMDFVPINIEHKLWLIRQNGKLSFLYPDGTISDLQPAESDMVYFTLSQPENELSVCLSTAVENGYIQIGQYPQDHITWNTVFRSSSPIFEYDLSKEEVVPGEEVQVEITKGTYLVLTRDSANQHYIYLPGIKKLYGPYESDEICTLIYLLDQDDHLVLTDKSGDIYGPFWSRDSATDSYILHSEDDKQTVEGLSQAQVADWYGIGGFDNSKFIFFNENLEAIYSGPFEGGAYPIGNIVPIKKDGKWKLIEFTEDLTGIEQSEPESEEENDTEDEEDLFKKLAGDYYYSSGAGAWSDVMTINEDGTFTAYYHDSDMGDTGPGYEHGTVYECKYSGKFKVYKTQPGDRKRIMIDDISFEKSDGEIEYVDNVQRITSHLDYMVKGQVFGIYEPGTNFDDLDEATQSWLYMNKEDVINRYVIEDKNTGVVFQKPVNS